MARRLSLSHALMLSAHSQVPPSYLYEQPPFLHLFVLNSLSLSLSSRPVLSLSKRHARAHAHFHLSRLISVGSDDGRPGNQALRNDHPPTIRKRERVHVGQHQVRRRRSGHGGEEARQDHPVSAMQEHGDQVLLLQQLQCQPASTLLQRLSAVLDSRRGPPERAHRSRPPQGQATVPRLLRRRLLGGVPIRLLWLRGGPARAGRGGSGGMEGRRRRRRRSFGRARRPPARVSDEAPEERRRDWRSMNPAYFSGLEMCVLNVSGLAGGPGTDGPPGPVRIVVSP